MLKHIHTENIGPAATLDLEFASRLNLITGDNGLGKTFILDLAWWVLTRKWPTEINPRLAAGFPARPAAPGEATISFSFTSKNKSEKYACHFDRKQQIWKGKRSRPSNPGLVIYAQVDGGFAVWDPARNDWHGKADEAGRRPPAYVFGPRDVWDGLTSREGVLCNGLIADWASWQKEGVEPFLQLRRVLAVLSPSQDEMMTPGKLTRISLNDVRDIPTLHVAYDQDVPIIHASAGVRRAVSLAYLLIWVWQEHSRASKLLDQDPATQVIFLIDEIEAHLHPKWQRVILRALLAVVEQLTEGAKSDVQIIAATHSPLVLASVEPFFDARHDAWFDLDLTRQGDAARVELRRRDFVRHGDASNWLTSQAFDLKSARSIEAEQAIEKARALLRRRGGASIDEARAVDAELRAAALPDIDPFWVGWGAFMEQIGVAP